MLVELLVFSSPQSCHSFYNREKHRKVKESVSIFFSAMEIDSIIDFTQSEEENKATARPLNTTHPLVQHFKMKQ